jgi:glycosyltransferase involved in cell wall biosynthesis
MTTRNYLSQREFLAIIFIATLLFSLSPCSSAPEESDTWSVSWNAPFLSISGYGSEATSFLVGLNRTLSREKWNLAAGLAHGDMIDEKYVDKIPEDLKDLLETSYQNQMRRMDPNKTIVICHSEPGAWSVPDPLYDPGWPCPPPLAENRKWQKMIGRTMFETDRLPANWNHRLNEMDEIWVPTHHHEQIFTDAGVKKPIVVVGQGIDIEYWNPEIRQEYFMEQYDKKFRCSNDDFKFLSVFKWEARKGPDILLPSFYEAFPNGEGACLIIITSSYHGDTNLVVDEVKRNWIEATKGMNGNKAQGVILMTGLPLRNLVRMYKSVDAFVLPSRGEGWGRPYMEAMSMGLPVIATNWSGPTEFVNEYVSLHRKLLFILFIVLINFFNK